YQSAAELRTDLQRVKRDTDSGRVPGTGSGAVAAIHDSDSRHLTPRPESGSGQVPAPTSSAAVASPSSPSAGSSATAAPVSGKKSRLPLFVGAALLLALAIAGGFYFRSRRTSSLTEKDTVVLADFANTTGDPVFDGTLKQALAVDLEQSPF